jgi:hypothetical protein
MKRKAQPKPEPVIPAVILEDAKRSISTDRWRKVSKCTVCGSETQGNGSDEVLCWVCRRLKVSAWRDNEQQMPAQE